MPLWFQIVSSPFGHHTSLMYFVPQTTDQHRRRSKKMISYRSSESWGKMAGQPGWLLQGAGSFKLQPHWSDPDSQTMRIPSCCLTQIYCYGISHVCRVGERNSHICPGGFVETTAAVDGLHTCTQRRPQQVSALTICRDNGRAEVSSCMWGLDSSCRILAPGVKQSTGRRPSPSRYRAWCCS